MTLGGMYVCVPTPQPPALWGRVAKIVDVNTNITFDLGALVLTSPFIWVLLPWDQHQDQHHL